MTATLANSTGRRTLHVRRPMTTPCALSSVAMEQPAADADDLPVCSVAEPFGGAISANACLESAALLCGQKCVRIIHNESVYRLQLTKQGKLILTK